jgi:NodT family efflux transporter outer membrane factor (OMF) lipoprotein
MMTRGLSAGALAALLSACGHLPIEKPAFEAMKTQRAGLPADWTIAQMSGDPAATVADYSVFSDAQLSAYITEALENNRTLRASQESVRQSEASLRSTRAGLWPTLRAGLGVGATDGGAFNSRFSDEQYSFSVTGAYNVDIMGNLDASIKASVAGLRSTEATYELARRSLAAQTARAYFAMIEAQQQLDLAQRSLSRQQDTFRITQTRFDAGSVARDELVLGQSNLATQEAAIISSQASLRSAVRALEVLLGRFPQNKLSSVGALPDAPIAPPLGLPELTIRARPDVVAAELNLIQVFANDRIARLGPWPQLGANLGAALSNTTVNTTTNLFDFDNLAFTIGATIAQTIFDGGAISARIDNADSLQRQALERYGQTIIDAYANIVGAVDQFNTLTARQTSLQTASDAARETLRLGELRYNEGSNSLLDLLQVRDRADTAESSLIANRRARLEQWIVLHQALGGNPTKSQPLSAPTNTADPENKKAVFPAK